MRALADSIRFDSKTVCIHRYDARIIDEEIEESGVETWNPSYCAVSSTRTLIVEATEIRRGIDSGVARALCLQCRGAP